MNKIVEKCRVLLSRHYGNHLAGVVLYGSVARQTNDSSSDIDLLVLLEEPFDYYAELKVITDLLYPIQLNSEQLISAHLAARDEYERGNLQLYRNVQREGVRV